MEVCSTLGCQNPPRSDKKGRCEACYRRDHRAKPECVEEGCTKKAEGHDRCRPHEHLDFAHWSYKQSLEAWQRIARSVDYRPETGCWVWAERMDDGRPRFTPKGTKSGKSWVVYRFTYVWTYGGHSPRRGLDHLCSEPACVNPRHVFPVTNTQNRKNGSTKPGFEHGIRGKDRERWWCFKDENGEWLDGPPRSQRLDFICYRVGLNPKRWTPPGMVDEQFDPFSEITATA